MARPDDADPQDEEGASSALLGVGRPVLGYRNWEGYAAARDGPDTRHRDRRGWPAKGQAELLQRWRPELMLGREGLEEVLREDRADRRARRAEGMQLQGNSLWLPPVAPVLTTPSHTDNAKADDDDDDDDDDSATPRRRCRRLVVHPGGPIMDRLHLSWVHEELSPTASFPKCWMAGGRWGPGEVGTVRQLAPLNQYQDLSGNGGAFPFVADPPTCFARGGVEAALFQLRLAAAENEGMLVDGDEGEEEMTVPYYVSPVQKLQFPHRLLDVTTRPASVHRAAFLTERLQVYEWSSARGASLLSLELPAAATTALPDSGWPAGHQARLAWGAHPRCLWLSSHGSLCQLDLRRRRAAAFQIDPPNWPRDLLPPATETGAEATAGGETRAGAALLRSIAAGGAVGPVERHPLDENLLFVTADHSLLTLDLRQPRRPLSVLPQAEATHLLTLGLCPAPSLSPSSRPRTWIAAGCRTLPRLHLHLESQTPTTGMGLVEEWLAQGFDGPRRGQRPVGYETGTFVNWDCAPGRDAPVWLAGLGALPSAPWGASSNGSSSSSSSCMVLPYLTSLGDVYLQRVLLPSSSTHGDGDADTILPSGLRPYPATSLPCGVSPHCMEEEESMWTDGPLPSSALLQPWDAQSIRAHRAVAVDPPATLFGDPLSTTDALPFEMESSIKPDHEQSSLAATTAAVRAAVGRVRGPLAEFMARHPRSLLEVAAELERLSPGTMAGGVEEALRALHAVLSSHGGRAGLARVQAGDGLTEAAGATAAAVVRPEEPARATAATAAAAAEQEQEQKEGAGVGVSICTCEEDGATGHQPCGAPACLRPARALYWQRDSEALAPRTTSAAAVGMGGGSSASVVHGLDEDVLQHLRGAWYR